MARSFRRTVRRFLRHRKGVSAIEFAIGAPLVILLFLMGVDTIRFVIATEKIDDVATTISQVISQNQTGSVTYVDLQFYHDVAMVIFPQILADAKQRNMSWSNDIDIGMASVKFTATTANCGASCVYIPQMVWAGGSSPRSCVVPLLAASDTAQPSPITLPKDAFGPGSITIVDVAYNFRPTIAPFFLQTIPIRRSYYMAPRYVPLIKYQTIAGDNGIAAPCPAFV
ncbi:MAG TPA: TadE/TadG family type IV pilus assembly protein [Lichenihabitans sp.]|jgi:hypothetical protein|nr:TadE/TadG family type IV pilus assembly protein [Lichenihabitans sp.]